jgi:hypothetical protein
MTISDSISGQKSPKGICPLSKIILRVPENLNDPIFGFTHKAVIHAYYSIVHFARFAAVRRDCQGPRLRLGPLKARRRNDNLPAQRRGAVG